MTLARTHWREIVLTALASLALIAAVGLASVGAGL